LLKFALSITRKKVSCPDGTLETFWKKLAEGTLCAMAI